MADDADRADASASPCDDSQMPGPQHTPGELAYLTYARVFGGISSSGGRIPGWLALSSTRREAWERAAREVAAEVARGR